MRVGTTALLVSLSLLAGSGAARSAPGNLDPRFGSDGVVTAALGRFSAQAEAIALQPDGKIVVAGWMWLDDGEPAVTLNRYLADGSIDPSFFSSSWADGARLWAKAVALQADGKILVAGPSYGPSRFVVKRFRANGTPDPSFGSAGEVALALGDSSGAYGIAVQPDGKIVAVGYAGTGSTTDFVAARFQQDGTLDAAFGSGGVVTTPIGTAGGAEAVALQPDGRIVTAGSSSLGGGFSSVTLARYDINGTLDPSFGAGGVVTTSARGPYDAQARGLALQPDGKIVVAGYDSGRGFALDRYTPSGELDSAFGTGGRVFTKLGSYSEADGVAVQPDGGIVAAGRAPIGAISGFAVVRYEADGSPDATFGREGVVVSDLSSLPTIVDAKGSALALQPDGKIVVGGTVQRLTGSGTPTFALARYLVTPGCRAPEVRGHRLAAAKQAITRAGCSVGRVRRARSNRVARGSVISQRPRAGTGLPELAPVSLVVSKGKR